MSETAKFRLNLNSGEIAIEGSEAFVEKQIDSLQSLMLLFSQKEQQPAYAADARAARGDAGSKEAERTPERSEPGDNKVEHLEGMPETHGEWMHSFRTELTDEDKALITARYVQSKSKGNEFKTLNVNKALKDHGIKLANPS